MGLLAGFIGIDRHRDPQIRDLSGAARDATALWALISDSLPGVNATRLIDSAATQSGVRKLFAQTLGAAAENDVVILSFAGHGTSDHRLVLSDTEYSAIPDTTISMGELAQDFRNSRARAVVCFLDCCFSGGAPARVLDGTPDTRNIGFPLVEVAGAGRILFSASNTDEEALEDPKTRHGLFTKAVMDCLLERGTPSSVLSIVDNVVKVVRAEAARLGYQQTPVVFGHVEGEVTLPAIERGALFSEHFPEYGGVKVSSHFSDLRAFGIGESVLSLWEERFPDGMNTLQVSAINEHGILDGESVLTVAPTSAGKTFVGEMAAIKAIERGEKAVFLLPYKALVDEKYSEFSELYGECLGLRVARCSGDWQDQVGTILRGKYDIAFFTYETFLGLAIASPYLLSQLGLVVVDEAQFIADTGRGIVVELLLTNLISARAKGVDPQIVALSAVIGSTNNFEKWLNAELQIASERPVPLIEGVMDRAGLWLHRDEEGNPTESELIPAWDIQVRRKKESSQDQIVPLVRKLVAAGEKVIVFRNNRGAAAGCAGYLAAELELPSADNVVEQLPRFDQSSRSQQLRECLSGGTAFHTTDLNRDERRIVEAAFRDPGGLIRVLAATTTVAAGVNTPASTVIIVETGFRGADGVVPYTVATYKNMAGRAGRLGYEDEGKAILLADNGREKNRYYEHYITGQPEGIKSSFDSSEPDTWLIRLLAQVQTISRDQAVELIANTYGGYLANLAQPGWGPAMEGEVRALLSRMEVDGLVESEGKSHICLSILGHACGQSPLRLKSSLRLIEMLRQVSPEALTAESLMALIQALPEQDERYTPMGRGARAESGRAHEMSSRFGGLISGMLQRYAASDVTYYARCKRSLILADWISGIPMDEIEAKYTSNPFSPVGHGDSRGLADATRFYLSSALRIAVIMREVTGPNEEEIEAFLQRLDLGLPEDALGLTELPVVLQRGEYLALRNANLKDSEQVMELEHERLVALLGETRAWEIRTQNRPT